MNMWISPAVASSVHVCMDKGRDGGWAGRIYIRISEEAFSFHDMYEMLSFLECFYDYIEFPKMSTISRTFKDSPPGVRSG